MVEDDHVPFLEKGNPIIQLCYVCLMYTQTYLHIHTSKLLADIIIIIIIIII